ncbi:ATP-binding protein [Bdellovibrio bacteriovorus]
MGDPTRIRQVLSNLISNSIKFTTEGFIRVELMKNQTNMEGNLIFHVSDTGIGIPREKIPQLFQPFTQADSTITRKFGGTGLGLSISKRLVKMMNGDITIESELHRGSRFSFSLDLPWLRDVQEELLAQVTATVPASSSQTPQEPLSILIVDDTDDNRLLIKAYLKNTPHQITEAANGQQALDLVQKQRFDLILMDMQMPVMDGFTATQKIRKWEKDHKLPAATIWALTAFALKNEIDRSLSVGCNMHLVKPLRKADLLNHIQKLSEERHQHR